MKRFHEPIGATQRAANSTECKLYNISKNIQKYINCKKLGKLNAGPNISKRILSLIILTDCYIFIEMNMTEIALTVQFD